ncbi:MFS transporter [Trebonia kvetii]|uniref:MFS transporter n=1 Tax=Trebonia kvetii TaxID=2480626 RepID=A0A6P2C2F8_9ACTN|nr:MFS transporter [Trebonia kvetii]TVZ05564.1 MFS transporter [Trebonia kvetii]
MRLLTDVTPLREIPAFRRLWLGTMLSRTGSAMTTFAITLQAYNLTRSTAAVGGIGLATFLPLLLITLPGGTFADRVDRRKLVLAITCCQLTLSAALFALTAAGAASLWALYAVVAVSAGLSAVSAPAQQTFIPRLVPRSQLAAAMALQRIVFQVVLITGPALAGVVAATAGLRGCYLADVASFAGALWGVSGLPVMPPVRESTGPATEPAAGESDAAVTGKRMPSGLAQTLAGLAFIRRTPALCGAFLADVNATFFALPVSLFPAINAERFGGNPRTLGLFATAIGVGGLVSAVFAGPLRHTARHGLVMLACVAVWGGAFALFAVAPTLWLTLLALALAGLADTFTVVIRGMIVQQSTPDEFRGRVNAADFLVGAGGSELGSLEAGVVGSLTTPVISALSGGLLAVAGAVAIGAALPQFRRYRATTVVKA